MSLGTVPRFCRAILLFRARGLRGAAGALKAAGVCPSCLRALPGPSILAPLCSPSPVAFFFSSFACSAQGGRGCFLLSSLRAGSVPSVVDVCFSEPPAPARMCHRIAPAPSSSFTQRISACLAACFRVSFTYCTLTGGLAALVLFACQLMSAFACGHRFWAGL